MFSWLRFEEEEVDVQFLPDAQQQSAGVLEFKHSDLKRRLLDYVKDEDQIVSVEAHTCADSEYRVRHLFFLQAFIVLEVGEWWWSVQKTDNCLILQRSKKRTRVKDHCCGHPRPGAIKEVGGDTSSFPLKDFMEMLCKPAHKPDGTAKSAGYHLISLHNKTFAQVTFNKLSSSRSWNR